MKTTANKQGSPDPSSPSPQMRLEDRADDPPEGGTVGGLGALEQLLSVGLDLLPLVPALHLGGRGVALVRELLGWGWGWGEEKGIVERRGETR